MTTKVGTHLDQPPLIRALLNPCVYGPGVASVTLIETHISWVLLTGDFAYKLKKPLNLGFLDFSTLEKRLQACREELRLNRRTAPAVYLQVIAVTGSAEKPLLTPADSLTAAAPVVDYAVKMREFPQSAQLDRRLKAGLLGLDEMDAIGAGLAAFHGSVAVAGADTPWGEPGVVRRFVDENFAHGAPAALAEEEREALAELRAWSDREFARLEPLIAGRKRDGFVRECHGDLHLTNLAALEDGITAFDCIEFNPALRWVDVVSEVAFLMMDLESRDRDDLAFRFANAYLEATGDYASLALLRYYLAYRSMVRAKVTAIRLKQGQLSAEERKAEIAKYRAHVALAVRTGAVPRPLLVITCGLSGSGKTWLSDKLVTGLPAFRIRSDVERKRLHDLAPAEASGSGLDAGIYSPAASRRTYARLAELAALVAKAGYSVILDGAFLKRDHRQMLTGLAAELGLGLAIVQCHAPAGVLEERIRRRSQAGGDASEADLEVLAHQRGTAEPLDRQEQAAVVRIDTGDETDLADLVGRIRRLCGAGR